MSRPFRGPSSTRYIAASTSAPPTSIRTVSDSPPNSTAKNAAQTGSMVMMTAVRVAESWDCAQVCAKIARAPGMSAM